MIELDNRVVYWRATKYGPDHIPVHGDLSRQYGQHLRQWSKRYQTFQALPTKAQEDVAVLSMNVAGERTPGVGMRVSQFVFWLEDERTVREIEYDDSVSQEK